MATFPRGHSATNTVNRQKLIEARADGYFWAFVSLAQSGQQRSIRELHRTLIASGHQVANVTLQKYSVRFHWADRLAAWEAAQSERLRERMLDAQVKEKIDMERRHVVMARALQIKGSQGLQALPAADLDADDVSRLIDTGVKIERVARGLPTEIVGLRISIYNEVVRKLVALFYQAADLPTLEERKAMYAQGVDQLGQAWLLKQGVEIEQTASQ